MTFQSQITRDEPVTMRPRGPDHSALAQALRHLELAAWDMRRMLPAGDDASPLGRIVQALFASAGDIHELLDARDQLPPAALGEAQPGTEPPRPGPCREAYRALRNEDAEAAISDLPTLAFMLEVLAEADAVVSPANSALYLIAGQIDAYAAVIAEHVTRAAVILKPHFD